MENNKRIPWNKGLTKETDIRIRKQSQSMIGKTKSEEDKKRISEGLKNSEKFKQLRNSPEYRAKLSKAKLGNTQCYKSKGHPHPTKKGISLSWEHRKKIGASMKGNQCYNWKGGITKLSALIRESMEYSKWRLAVYTRDNFTCQNCHQVGNKLEAHHIKPFALLLNENKIKTIKDAENCQELWDINNGITLCEECHKQTDSYLKNGFTYFN